MIRKFKRIISGILSGTIFFTSLPAKAWNEVSPVKEVTKDLSLDGFPTVSVENFRDCIQGCWFVKIAEMALEMALMNNTSITMNNKYFKLLCESKKIGPENVRKLQIPFSEDLISVNVGKIKFPRLVSIEFYRAKKFAFRKEYASRHSTISCTAFSLCGNLRIVYAREKFDFVNENGYIVSNGNIDLFPLCDHSVMVVCGSEEIAQKFKNIMGNEGKRHRIVLDSELEKYDIADKLPEKYKFDSPGLEDTSSAVIKTGSQECQNILIPKNVSKIEKEAFKKSKLVAVTFEEGMKEIELCDECFAECNLVKFELPKSLKKIVLGKDCFKKCPNAYSIEEYVKSEQRRIEKEEEEERQRKEKEEQEERKRKEAEERDLQAKKLEKWKNGSLKSINESKKKIEEEIRLLEKNRYDKSIELKVRTEDVKKKQKKESSLTSEIEWKLFKAEKAVLEKEVEISKMSIDVIDAKLEGKKELLKSYVDHVETLKNAKKIDNLFIENIKASQLLQHFIEEKQKILDDTKKELERLELVQWEIANKKDKLEKQAIEQAEKDREQARKDREQAEESERLKKEREEIEKGKNKGFFSNLAQKICDFNPIESVKQEVKDKFDNMTHKLVVRFKIVSGIVAVALAAQLCIPIVKLCASIRQFLRPKAK